MKILLVGMGGLYNRGCEAIVRGSAKILKKVYPKCQVAVAVGYPENVPFDQQRLTDVGIEVFPLMNQRQRVGLPLRLLRRGIYELTGNVSLYRYRLPVGYPEGWDLLLEVGGDTFEGNPLFLFHHDQWLRRRKGFKVGLWGLNLGPYNDKVISKNSLTRGFAQFPLITVRDDFSKKYLADLGVTENVFRMADPAFAMEPEPWDLQSCIPIGRLGRIGVNLSPLIAGFLDKGVPEMITLGTEAIESLISIGFGVLLIPHCVPPGCPPNDDDTMVLDPIYRNLKSYQPHITILPEGLSAPQVKYAISHCKIAIVARMHAGIAAWSSGVPVLSLSYSQKSINMNDEIYGHQKYVLKVRDLTMYNLLKIISIMNDNYLEVQAETINSINRMLKYNDFLISQLRQISIFKNISSN